jgi:hypothetical protein
MQDGPLAAGWDFTQRGRVCLKESKEPFRRRGRNARLANFVDLFEFILEPGRAEWKCGRVHAYTSRSRKELPRPFFFPPDLPSVRLLESRVAIQFDKSTIVRLFRYK